VVATALLAKTGSNRKWN